MDLNYNDLNKKWNYPEECTDIEELSNYDSFYNTFTRQFEKNNCFYLKINNKSYTGSDKQFEEILTLFPNHLFKQVSSDNKYVTAYSGYLNKETDDYFTLVYSGDYISKFDLVLITLKGDESAFSIIKEKYNLK